MFALFLADARPRNGKGTRRGEAAQGALYLRPSEVTTLAINPSVFGDPRRRRFRRIPVRTLAPNMVTLLAMCAGLTAIRMAFEEHFVLAVAGVVFAAILDGIDGRLARLLKGTSRFGAELDSLSDFVNFGVAPALILYFWGLHDLKSAGWIAAMVFAICGSLRLARFNVMIDDPDRPVWTANFFVGVPAPAGAITVLLPIDVAFLGVPRSAFLTWATLVYTLAMASLMVSRLPVFSGKRVGTRVPPEMVGPLIVFLILCVALLIAYPWVVLTAGTLAYLVSLPFGYLSYRKHERRSAEAKAESRTEPAAGGVVVNMVRPDDGDRPSRLN
jgi:CDP-diacylglycerol--serine O-phosphatidyltransferase